MGDIWLPEHLRRAGNTADQRVPGMATRVMSGGSKVRKFKLKTKGEIKHFQERNAMKPGSIKLQLTDPDDGVSKTWRVIEVQQTTGELVCRQVLS